jgi:hypothetical protein
MHGWKSGFWIRGWPTYSGESASGQQSPLRPLSGNVWISLPWWASHTARLPSSSLKRTIRVLRWLSTDRVCRGKFWRDIVLCSEWPENQCCTRTTINLHIMASRHHQYIVEMQNPHSHSPSSNAQHYHNVDTIFGIFLRLNLRYDFYVRSSAETWASLVHTTGFRRSHTVCAFQILETMISFYPARVKWSLWRFYSLDRDEIGIRSPRNWLKTKVTVTQSSIKQKCCSTEATATVSPMLLSRKTSQHKKPLLETELNTMRQCTS